MRPSRTLLVVISLAARGFAQVVSSEFFSDPVSEGWPLLQQYCDPELWNDDGLYYQQLDFDACSDTAPPGGGQDEYLEDIDEFNGSTNWFFEFRVMTNGDRSEIPGGAPIALTAFNFFGENYGVVMARDQVKLYRDAALPILFIDLASEVPHTIRLDLNNLGQPTYKWYIDGVLIDEGPAEDVFPSDDARITWRGKAWYLPCENAWDYIRYGVIPQIASEDFDSDGDIDLRDFRYFHECVGRTGEVPGDPGCHWADTAGEDGVVDLRDFAVFQTLFTGKD